jgi:chromate transporter
VTDGTQVQESMKLVAPPRLLQMVWVFLRLGAVAFGGLGATIALIQSEIVGKRGWLSAEDVRDGLAFTKPLPGSTGVQVVAFLAWRLRRWPGALLASVAYIAPAAAMMTAAAAAAIALPDHAAVRGALTGIQVAVVGLLAAAMWKLAQGEVKGRGPMVTLIVAAALGFMLHPVLIVVGAGLIGAAFDERGRQNA